MGKILKESLKINLQLFHFACIEINLCKSFIIEVTLLILISGKFNKPLKIK